MISQTLPMLNPAQINAEYWSGKIEGRSIVWQHSNIENFFAGFGLKLPEAKASVTDCSLTSFCGRCKKSGLSFSASSRSEAAELCRDLYDGRGRCTECSQLDKQEREIAAKKAADAEAAEKKERRDNHRKSLELRHGILMTGEPCPECGDGFLIVRLNSTEMKPFLGCSHFNPVRYSCKYAQPLAPEMHETFMPTFRQRLAEKEVKGVGSNSTAGCHAA